MQSTETTMFRLVKVWLYNILALLIIWREWFSSVGSQGQVKLPIVDL